MVQERAEALRTQKLRIRTDQLVSQLVSSYVQNTNVRNAYGTASSTLFSENPKDAWERNNLGLMDRSIPLNPDYTYKAPAKPAVLADLEKISQRFAAAAASIMDFPLEMVQPVSAARASNVQGNLRFVNERIKDALVFFEQVTKRAFLVSYGRMVQQSLDDVVRTARILSRKSDLDAYDIVDLHARSETHVEMSCTPIVSYDELKKVWMDGMMTKDTFAKHAFHMHSLPHEDINVTDWPDGVPKELLVKSQSVKKEGFAAAVRPPKKKPKADLEPASIKPPKEKT